MTLKRINSVWIFFVLILQMKSFAQTDMPRVIPPSPQTQALISLPEFNMGMADGLPTINIPIYEVKSGKLSLPISISYNPQGRKVTDLSGPVGIGWSLNCGGVIARTVYGKPDEWASFPSVMPQASYMSNTTDYQFILGSYYDNSSFSTYDTEYDIYNFQCGSKSGKFVFSRNGPPKTYLIPRYDIQINHPSGFPNEIVDDNGDLYQYNYNETERFYKNGQSSGGNIVTAGYLTKLQSPYGDEINLSYVGLTKEVYAKNQERILYDNPVGYSVSVPSAVLQIQNVSTAINLVRVSEILFKHGKVVFEFINANDQIKFIKVFNSSNQLVKSFEFVYSILDNSDYVYGVNGNPNLSWIHYNYKLDGIKISDENGTEVQHYGFEYNPSETFTVQSKDFWGFRNASTQTNLLTDYYAPYTTGTLNVGTGANRDPNGYYSVRGTLKKIVYPTGGSTEFTYESNQVKNANNNIVYGPGLRIKEIKQISEGGVASSKTYEYPTVGEVPYYPTSNYVHRSVETREFPLYKTNQSRADLMGNNYRKRIFSSEILPEFQGLMQQPVFYESIIEYQNNESVLGKTEYTYEKAYQGYPTQIYPPDMNAGYIYPTLIIPGYYGAVQQDYYSRTSYLSNMVLENSARQNGISYYKYTPNSTNQFELVSSKSFHYTFKPSDPLLGLKFNKYLYFLQDGNYSLSWETMAMSQDNFPVYQPVNYEIPTGYYELTKKGNISDGIWTTTDLEYNTHFAEKAAIITNSKGETEKTESFYPYDFPLDASMQALVTSNRVSGAVETKTTNVSSNLIVSGTKIDYQNWGGNVYEPVTLKKFSKTNGLEPVVDFKKYDSGGNVLGASKHSAADVVYIYAYKGDFPILEINNADYQSVENALGGFTNVNNIRLSNPDRSTVNNLVATLYTALPNAMITSYTYRPLVGMTSKTDAKGMTTYYEYDSFQRLKLIRDQNNNIVKTYCYNYAGQVTDCNTGGGTTPQPTQVYARIEVLNPSWSAPIDGSTTEADIYLALYSDAGCTQPVSRPQGFDVNVSTTGTYFYNNNSSVSSWTNTYSVPANTNRVLLGRYVTDSWYSYYDPYYGMVINSENYTYQVEDNGANVYIPSPTY